MLTADDRIAIADVINLHGHLTDRGDFTNMPTLFAEAVTYDVSALGGGVLVGLSAIREAALALGRLRHPVEGADASPEPPRTHAV